MLDTKTTAAGLFLVPTLSLEPLSAQPPPHPPPATRGFDEGHVEELCRRLDLLLTRVATQSFAFSEVNTIVANAETALGVAAGGCQTSC